MHVGRKGKLKPDDGCNEEGFCGKPTSLPGK
jgi:hypothetical protein